MTPDKKRPVRRGNNVIKYVPDRSVTKLNIGDRTVLSAADFGHLAAGILTEIGREFR